MLAETWKFILSSSQMSFFTVSNIHNGSAYTVVRVMNAFDGKGHF